MYKVVIIDDEPWIIKDLKALVNWKELGFDLAGEANCSSEGEILIDRIKPDLLISDIKMPDMSGIELLQRRRNKGDSVMTIFLSAYSDFSYAQQALKLGAYDYLLKPVESKVLEELLCKVKIHLNNRNSNILDSEDGKKVKHYSNTIIQEIIADIETNYTGKIELNIIANKYYLNPFYLSQLFKKEVGKSFTAYLIETRLNKAADLLKDPRLTLYQVSDMVGYGDYVHFSKIFSKYKGASPAIYRRKIVEK